MKLRNATPPLLLLFLLACGANKRTAAPDFPRREELAEIRSFEKSLGFEPTSNLARYSKNTDAFYRCYYTEKLKLPASYEGLRLKEGSASGCQVNEDRYDVFFYPAETVAGGGTPVTSSLVEASPERLMVVVTHEDFHRQENVRSLPDAMHEAAAMLIGLLSAAEFTERKFGVGSEEHHRVRRESEIFLRKSKIVNRYHSLVGGLYRCFYQRRISRSAALAEKERLYQQLEDECTAIEPAPASFNRCPAVLNNAGLAFDMTYTRYYPLLHGLHVALGDDLEATVRAIHRPQGPQLRSKKAAVEYFSGIVEGNPQTRP